MFNGHSSFRKRGIQSGYQWAGGGQRHWRRATIGCLLFFQFFLRYNLRGREEERGGKGDVHVGAFADTCDFDTGNEDLGIAGVH